MPQRCIHGCALGVCNLCVTFQREGERERERERESIHSTNAKTLFKCKSATQGPCHLFACNSKMSATGKAYGQSPFSTKILDFRGFDSSRILILRGGIPMSTGNFWKS